jgi:hypothetical protein
MLNRFNDRGTNCSKNEPRYNSYPATRALLSICSDPLLSSKCHHVEPTESAGCTRQYHRNRQRAGIS